MYEIKVAIEEFIFSAQKLSHLSRRQCSNLLNDIIIDYKFHGLKTVGFKRKIYDKIKEFTDKDPSYLSAVIEQIEAMIESDVRDTMYEFGLSNGSKIIISEHIQLYVFCVGKALLPSNIRIGYNLGDLNNILMVTSIDKYKP